MYTLHEVSRKWIDIRKNSNYIQVNNANHLFVFLLFPPPPLSFGFENGMENSSSKGVEKSNCQLIIKSIYTQPISTGAEHYKGTMQSSDKMKGSTKTNWSQAQRD